jgi:hypothetical protein
MSGNNWFRGYFVEPIARLKRGLESRRRGRATLSRKRQSRPSPRQVFDKTAHRTALPQCRIISHPRQRWILKPSLIPPTAVGGYFQILSTQSAAQTLSNPTHGSGWILSDPLYSISGLKRSLIPPTAVGGFFQIISKKGSEPSTNCRWWDSQIFLAPSIERISTIHQLPLVGFADLLSSFNRKDLNHPPTAVGGIRRSC